MVIVAAKADLLRAVPATGVSNPGASDICWDQAHLACYFLPIKASGEPISVVSSPINHAFTLIGESAAKSAAAEAAGCEPIELSREMVEAAGVEIHRTLTKPSACCTIKCFASRGDPMVPPVIWWHRAERSGGDPSVISLPRPPRVGARETGRRATAETAISCDP